MNIHEGNTTPRKETFYKEDKYAACQSKPTHTGTPSGAGGPRSLNVGAERHVLGEPRDMTRLQVFVKHEL